MEMGPLVQFWEQSMHRLSKILLIIFVLALIAGAGIGGYYLFTNRDNNIKSQKVDGVDAASVIKSVGNLIELPSGEQPNIAIVRDVKKLQEQEIFRKSKNGDILLIYVEAKRAYLYRPSTGKLVDVAPVNLQKQPSR